ncbi:MAG TPA: questin oxidase family protein [Rhizobium sp.]
MPQAMTYQSIDSPYPDPRTGAWLKILIAESGRRSGEFPAYLANHLPMVLEAMGRLGASPSRLEEYAEHYTRIHDVPFPPPSIAAIDNASWLAALGQRERESDLRQFFEGIVAEIGGSAAIRRYLPVLFPGVAASATHGLMRLAYATLRKDDTELAAALGYWAATYLAYEGVPGDRVADVTDPVAYLISMREEPTLHNVEAPTYLLWKWIEAMGKIPAFQHRIGRIAALPDTLDRIRPGALALYAGTMSFEALHAVTGCHWLRLISPCLDEPQRLAVHFWEVVFALYTKIGMPAAPSPELLDTWRRVPLPSDQDIAAAAVASNDEHDHSLVFSAFEEYRHTGDRLYKVVAARRVGLID